VACLTYNGIYRAFARDPKGGGFESRPVRFQLTVLSKLLMHTHVLLLPSSIIWYRPMGDDVLPAGRVTADLAESNGSLYRWVDGLMSPVG